MAKVYVASSWRNEYYADTIEALQRFGHEVWDWKNPPTGGSGFRWQDVGAEEYKHGDKVEIPTLRGMLRSPVARAGFASDLAGMYWCDVGVIVYPSGRSAHMEAGWLAGRGKTVHILAPEPIEPDLMVGLFNGQICENVNQLVHVISGRAL